MQRPCSTALLSGFVALGVPLALMSATPAAGTTPLSVIDSGHALVWDGVTVHSTPGLISDPHAIPLPGADRGVAVLWREAAADGRLTDAYALSLDGRRFARARDASHVLRLRFAEFDPLLRRVEVAPALAADPAAELAIVQFLTRPLAEYATAIRAAGGEVHAFLADQALIARLPPAARATVERMPLVRWVGPVHPAYKLEDEILAALAAPGALTPRRYSIMCYERGPAAQERVAAALQAAGGIVHGTTPAGFRLEATLDGDQVLAAARLDDVMFIDRKGEQEADLDIARMIGGGDYVHTLGFRGTGVTGEVMDTELELAHPEWEHPPLVHLPGGDIVHGTRVYGILFAQGLDPRARGFLPDGQGIYAYRTPLLGGGPTRYEHTAELVDPAGPYRAVFQSVSTGDLLTTTYTTISAEMDDILFLYDILVTQSQSNNGDQLSRPQAWAKNIVACGGIKHLNTLDRSDDRWGGYASTGPAADGRVKPDLAHFCDYIYTTNVGGGYVNLTVAGTSCATPITAGHFGLLFQMWHEGVFPGFGGGATVFDDRPHMTTARALLINTAYRYDWHVAGPNSDLDRFKQGWGMVDLRKLHDDRERLLIVDESDLLAPLGVREYAIDVGADDMELRATLVYADPRGNVGSSWHRINDLSLRATSPLGTIYWGNSGLAGDNWSVPGGASNTIDTVENVFIADPEPGTWTLAVLADEVIEDSHLETPELDADFALVAAAHASPSPPPPPPPVLWDNGPLVTHPGQGVGGADASARQSVTLGEAVFGYNHQVAAGARVADDFTADDAWTVRQIELWAYQTGAGPANPTITSANIRIWDGSPMVPGSRVVFGDSLTDLLTAAVWDTLYRTDETTIQTATDRAVYRLTCSVPDWRLVPGTYWIDWQVDGALPAGPFVPPISIPGATHPPGANAIQLTSGTWHAVVDAGSQAPDDFKFVLRGEAQTTAGTGPEALAPERTAVLFRPNPFRRDVAIELALARPGEASLRLHDVAGRLVRVLIEGRLTAGTRSLRWDGRDEGGAPLAAGIYLYELRVDGQVQDRGKAVLLR